MEELFDLLAIGTRRFVAVPADELADVGPVLLLDMGVVVLLLGPAPGEADLPIMAITVQIMVDELAAVVRCRIESGPERPAPRPAAR